MNCLLAIKLIFYQIHNIMKNLNLVPILKNHIGESFYSPTYGEVILESIVEGVDYPIAINNDKERIILTEQGKYYKNGDIECIIFPSKDNRDWSTFNHRWCAKKGEKYYFILHPTFNPAYVEEDTDNYGELSNGETIHIDRFKNKNYFKTKAEAQFIVDKINKLFREL